MSREPGVYVLEFRKGYDDDEILRAETQEELLRKLAEKSGHRVERP